MAPFLAVAAELRGEMQRIARSVRGALGPAKTEGTSAAAAIRKMWQSTQGAHTGFRILRTAVGSVGPVLRSMGSAARGVLGGVASAARSAANAVGSIGGKLKFSIPGGGVLGPLAGIASAAAGVAIATSQLKTGMSVASDLERTTIAMEALTGSGAGAKKMMDEMRATWLRTGASISDQAATIQKFLALGFDSDQAVRLQRNILDVAGAVGMSTAEAALLGSALAQVKAKGVVSMEELRQQIAEKGVPVFEALSAKLGVTQGELMKLVEDGQVPAQQLLDIFMNMEGPLARFGGGAARMGATFGGLVARLRGAWSLLLADFAAPINDALRPILQEGIGLVESFRATAVQAGKVVGNALISGFALIRSGKTMELLAAGFKLAVTGAVDLLMRGMRATIAFLGAALPPIFESSASKIRDPMFWEGIKAIFRGIGDTIASILQNAIADLEQNMGKFGKADERRKLAQRDKDRAEQNFFMGSQAIKTAGDGQDLTKVLGDAVLKGSAAAAKAASGPASESVTESKKELNSLFATVREEVAKLRKGAEVPPPAPAAPGTPASPTGIAAQAQAGMQAIVTSLGRVGGGGAGGMASAFAPVVAQQKQSNTLLRRIADGVGRMSQPVPVA